MASHRQLQDDPFWAAVSHLGHQETCLWINTLVVAFDKKAMLIDSLLRSDSYWGLVLRLLCRSISVLNFAWNLTYVYSLTISHDKVQGIAESLSRVPRRIHFQARLRNFPPISDLQASPPIIHLYGIKTKTPATPTLLPILTSCLWAPRLANCIRYPPSP